MDKNRMTVLMTILCIVLLGVSAVVYLGKDREGPEISFGGDSVIYAQGDDTSVLLAGVTATDKHDGDVSDTVKIDRVTSMTSMDYVVVTYVARDRSNNISKVERWIDLTDGSTVIEPDEELRDDLEDESDELMEAMLTQTENKDADGEKETSSEKGTEETTAGGADGQTGTEGLNGAGDQNETGTNPETDGREPSSETATESEEALISTGAPIIRITSHDVTLHLGERFEYMSYVKTCIDDADTMDQLYSRIIVNGQDNDGNYVGAGTIDTNRLATYYLQYYVVDTDGNMSNIEQMTVRIEG